MAYTAPRTWVLGELITASIMNTHLRDNVSFLYNKPRFRVRNTAAQGPVGSTAPYDNAVYNTKDFDTSGTMFTGAGPWSGPITIPQTGLWLFSMFALWASSSAAGVRSCWINQPNLDGANYMTRHNHSRGDAQDTTPGGTCVGTWVLSSGQTIRTKVYTTASISTQSVMWGGLWVSY